MSPAAKLDLARMEAATHGDAKRPQSIVADWRWAVSMK